MIDFKIQGPRPFCSIDSSDCSSSNAFKNTRIVFSIREQYYTVTSITLIKSDYLYSNGKNLYSEIDLAYQTRRSGNKTLLIHNPTNRNHSMSKTQDECLIGIDTNNTHYTQSKASNTTFDPSIQ